MAKQRTGSNHFEMKNIIYLAAQQPAYKELKKSSTPNAAYILSNKNYVT